MRPITLISLLLFVLLGLGGGPAWAGSPIHIELNKLEPQEDACRAYFVLETHYCCRSPVQGQGIVVGKGYGPSAAGLPGASDIESKHA